MNSTSKAVSVFQNGHTSTSSPQLTQVWITLINQIERNKAIIAAK